MAVRRRFFFLAFLTLSIASTFAPHFAAQQPPPELPAASAARILLLPRRLVAGDRATLAVLDVNGRLTPGATVTFSNGDRIKTDATGRALFVAPMKPGALSGAIEGRPGRVATTILAPEEAAASSIEIASAPRVASLTDRFEMLGQGFCGDADGNHVTIAGQEALVLASSPVSVLVLPPSELSSGQAAVTVSCLRRKAPDFFITFVALDLQADISTLKPGEHRTLTVRVHGTEEKVSLEARNLAPDITELVGGNPVRRLSTGGPENAAAFEVVGQKNGSFLISIRLVPTLAHPK